MTDDPGSTPEAPAPPPAMPPPPPAAPPSSGWQQPAATAVPGIPGFTYADVPNRFIALIIDGFVIFVILVIVAAILGTFGLKTGVGSKSDLLPGIVFALVSLAITAGYFLYTWTSMRASLGMRALGMQVGNAYDGKTLTMDQATKRWVALWGPSVVSGALSGVPAIGSFISLIVLIYLIYLLYSTAKSPTKQGFHDKFANTVVVKAARAVG
jgi:uncharacterized RDD family membrane protein YckC